MIGSADNEALSSLAADYQKTWQALTIATQQKAAKSCDSLVAAEAGIVYGDKYKPPTDDVVNVDSPSTTTINHNYPSPSPASPVGLGKLLAAGVIGGALVAGGAGLASLARSPAVSSSTVAPPAAVPSPAPPAASKAYQLDFYEPPKT